MPWKETCPMDQRRAFIDDYLQGRYTKKDLCMYYDQPTHRRATGRGALRALSKPHWHPYTTAPEIAAQWTRPPELRAQEGPAFLSSGRQHRR